MTNFQFSNFIFNITVLDVVKWFLVVGLVMYAAFAVVVVRQVKIMSEAIEDEFNSLITAFAWIHFGVAIFLTGVAVVVL